jgi:hypothetical protein
VQRDFATRVTGWFFILAALMFWGGRMLLPSPIGTYFQLEDFPAVHAHLHLWIWMYRVHIFGMVVSVLALAALAALLAETPARMLVWPGVAVAGAGWIVAAVAAAYYYHFGAWGAVEMNGKAAGAVQSYVDSLRTGTEYVTCLVRFGRVFTGLGLVVLGAGLLKWKLLPAWAGLGALGIGAAAMALTMAFPDNLALYTPVFHLKSLWLMATGTVILRSGVRSNLDR